MSDTNIDIDDIDESDYDNDDKDFDYEIIVCWNCSVEIDADEDYKHIDGVGNYCVECFVLVEEQRHSNNNK